MTLKLLIFMTSEKSGSFKYLQQNSLKLDYYLLNGRIKNKQFFVFFLKFLRFCRKILHMEVE